MKSFRLCSHYFKHFQPFLLKASGNKKKTIFALAIFIPRALIKHALLGYHLFTTRIHEDTKGYGILIDTD